MAKRKRITSNTKSEDRKPEQIVFHMVDSPKTNNNKKLKVKSSKSSKMASPHLPTKKLHRQLTPEPAQSPMVGCGYPTTVRTLKKDISYCKKHFPGVGVEKIKEILIDSIPKEEDVVSSHADLETSFMVLEKFSTQQQTERKKSLRK